MKLPKLAFSTLACPDWDWDQIVTRTAEYGYEGVEIRQIAGDTDLLKVPSLRPSERAARRADLQRHGVTVCGLASSVRFDYPDRDAFDEQLRIGRAYLEMAAELECRFVRIFGDVLPAETEPVKRTAVLRQIADGLNQMGEAASDHQVDVLLETHGDFSQTAVVVELFRHIESPAVGVLWDTHHPWRFFQEPIEETFDQLRPWTRHTHWKDSVLSPEKPANSESAEKSAAASAAHALMSGHRHADYVQFGEGEFPIEACLRVLKESGYSGWLSLEWEKMWHPELAGPEVALPIYRRKMREIWSRISD